MSRALRFHTLHSPSMDVQWCNLAFAEDPGYTGAFPQHARCTSSRFYWNLAIRKMRKAHRSSLFISLSLPKVCACVCVFSARVSLVWQWSTHSSGKVMNAEPQNMFASFENFIFYFLHLKCFFYILVFKNTLRRARKHTRTQMSRFNQWPQPAWRIWTRQSTSLRSLLYRELLKRVQQDSTVSPGAKCRAI